MASFQAKQVRKGGEREKIKISFRSVPFRSYPTGNLKFQKKEKKKKEKYYSGFISSQNWLVKIERERERENKNQRSVPFQPDA